MTAKPMQAPAKQPIGFWTARAGEAIRKRTRGRLQEIGVTQPEWWLLHQLSLHPAGMDRQEAIELLGHNDTPEAIVDAIASASGKGWLSAEDDRLISTDAGTTVFRRGAEVQRELQAERMQGISEQDFVTTIEVLQRTVRNVGGDAWHW